MSADLNFDDTKSDLYYRYIDRTHKKRSYQYMITQEETRFNFHRHAAEHTEDPYSNWHRELACNAERRLNKWRDKLNESS